MPRKLVTLTAIAAVLTGAMALTSLIGSPAVAQNGGGKDSSQLQLPVYRVARAPSAKPEAKDPQTVVEPADALEPKPGEHPLAPAIRIAQEALARIDRDIVDYSATLVKRERIGDELGRHEYIFTKVRHKPFSVYMYFLGPDDLKGQECIYVEGQNDGNLLGHAGSGLRARFGTVSLAPDGMLAMQGQRYPITEVGIRNLTRRLIEVAESDSKYGECEVKWYKNTKVEGRPATCVEVIHPVPRKNFLFHKARVFIDNELQLPIRYEAYDWPKKPGAEPELLEEYTYVNLKLNNGFSDRDFDPRNPNYKF